PGSDDRDRDRVGGAVGVRVSASHRPSPSAGSACAEDVMTLQEHISPRAKGTHAPPRRFAWAQVVVACAFLVLIGRLYQLQVMSGEYYLRKSADNFVKELELPATRGQIRDRKGRILVDNRPAYNVYITPRFFNTDAFTKLKKYLQLSDEQAA